MVEILYNIAICSLEVIWECINIYFLSEGSVTLILKGNTNRYGRGI